MAAIVLQDNPATDVGNGKGHFLGALQYTVISPTQARLDIQLKNTTDPSRRGYITAFAFGNPSSFITGVTILYNDTGGMDLIGGPNWHGGVDCLNATTGWGNADIGLSIAADWNTAGYPTNLPSGIRNWQNGTFQLGLTGTSLNTLSEASFHAAVTSGATPVFFPVHFRWLDDEQSIAGDDRVASS